MPKTLTIVLYDNDVMNLITGGEILPEMAARLCLEAFKAYQEKIASEKIERLRSEENEDEPTPEG